MPPYVQFEEVRDGIGFPVRQEAYPDLRRYIRSAESRIRVQLGTLPPRESEDGEFVAEIIRDLAISRYLLQVANNAAVVEKGRELRQQAVESLVVYSEHADTPDLPPDTDMGDPEISGGVSLWSKDDYPTELRDRKDRWE